MTLTTDGQKRRTNVIGVSLILFFMVLLFDSNISSDVFVFYARLSQNLLYQN